MARRKMVQELARAIALFHWTFVCSRISISSDFDVSFDDSRLRGLSTRQKMHLHFALIFEYGLPFGADAV